MRKLSVRASKALDASKSRKVQAMKARRSASKAAGRTKKLQQSGSMQGKQAAKTRTGYRMK